MRRILLFTCAMSTLLVSYANAAPTKKLGWEYHERRDELRGTIMHVACTNSLQLIHLGFPYHSQHLRLCIRSKAADDLDIYFVLPLGGQFSCASDCRASIKIDALEVESHSASTSSDGSSNIIFVDEEPALLEKIKSGKKLLVETEYFTNGTQQVSFDISGLHWTGAAPASK